MRPLRILHCEDVEDDVLLVERELRREGWTTTWTRVETPEAFREALAREAWDLVLSDYHMPRFTAVQALALLQASPQRDLPFIVVSGSIGEAAAVAILQQGASDFVVKDNLARLAPAVARELADAEVRRERREAQTALAEALASREELIALAGHEFRNPLAALQLTVDALARSGRAPEAALALGRQAGRLRDLVTRLIDVAAINAGSFVLRISHVDLAAMARSVLRRLTEGAERIDARLPERLPLSGDYARLELVVVSLLENAVKFAPEGRIELTVTALADGGAELTVADRGPGPGAFADAPLERPYRKGVSSRHFGGFGIGLWLGRVIAEAHGGTLALEARDGGGAVARLRLPVSCSGS